MDVSCIHLCEHGPNCIQAPVSLVCTLRGSFRPLKGHLCCVSVQGRIARPSATRKTKGRRRSPRVPRLQSSTGSTESFVRCAVWFIHPCVTALHCLLTPAVAEACGCTSHSILLSIFSPIHPFRKRAAVDGQQGERLWRKTGGVSANLAERQKSRQRRNQTQQMERRQGLIPVALEVANAKGKGGTGAYGIANGGFRTCREVSVQQTWRGGERALASH